MQIKVRALGFLYILCSVALYGQSTDDRHYRMIHSSAGRSVVETHPAVTHTAVVPFQGDTTEPPAPPPQRVSSALRRELAGLRPTDRIEVLIAFDDRVHIPTIPKSIGNEPPDSHANQTNRSRREEIIRSIEVQRRAITSMRLGFLQAKHDIQILETFWLADVWRATVPVAHIERLAEEPSIHYLELPRSNTLPPYPVIEGRQRMNSDWFSNSTNMFAPFSAIRVAL